MSVVKTIVNKHGAVILTVLGLAGFAATVVMTAKVSPKVDEKLKEAEKEKGEKLDPIEVVKTAAPDYIPVVVVGGATVGCIIGVAMLDRKQQATIMSAYAMLERGYSRYKNKVKEICGVDAEKEVREAIFKEDIKEKKKPIKKPEQMEGDDICVFYEGTYNEFFERSFIEVLDAEYQLNRSLALNGYVSLADFYDLLGLERTPASEALGWNQDMGFETGVCTWVDFTHDIMETDDGMKCYAIKPSYEPIYGYDEWMRNL